MRKVDSTYEETKAMVGYSLQVMGRKVNTMDILLKLLYADDLIVVADSEADLQERLVDWKEIFGKYGLTVSLDKTEMLWVGQQKKDLDIKLDGKKLNQRDSFVYLGGTVCGNGDTETEIRRRIQAVASAWRKVEWVMGDRHIYRKLKGKVLNSCIPSAYPYGLETMALTETQQERLQVWENNSVRRSAGVNRIDRRRMEKLREKVGERESRARKLVRVRLKWIVHVDRMEVVRLTKRADSLGVES